jgi:RHS repeat-associated protein
VEDLLSGPRRLSLDPEGRVTGVAGPDWAESYGYDAAGNITAATWPAPPQSLDAAWLGTDVQGSREYAGTLITRAGDVRYQHDRQGRVTVRQRVRLSRKPESWQYSWDADDRLVAVTTPDGTVWRYQYDPLGRRIAKQHLNADGHVAEQTEFTWDGSTLAEQSVIPGRAGGQAQEGEVTTWDYRPGTFSPLIQAERPMLREAAQQIIDQRFYAIVTDLIGAPSELTALDGTLAGYQQRTLWGATLWHPGGASTPLRFPGQYADPESGLNYNHHRYYDPATGRYLSPDPLGLAPAPNPHTYVFNPCILTDPLGLDPGSGAGGSPGPTLFRGTAQGYDGGQASLRAGITPASTDPKVAAAFATHAEQFGQGVVHVATPADLAGLKVELNAGYLPYEAEAYVSTTPADFASRASTTISASTARSVLREMGIQVPGLIVSPADLTGFLRASPLMSSQQIAEFLARIGG